MKEVKYYCPGCRNTIIRVVTRATKIHVTFCSQAGKEVRARKLKNQ